MVNGSIMKELWVRSCSAILRYTPPTHSYTWYDRTWLTSLAYLLPPAEASNSQMALWPTYSYQLHLTKLLITAETSIACCMSNKFSLDWFRLLFLQFRFFDWPCSYKSNHVSCYSVLLDIMLPCNVLFHFNPSTITPLLRELHWLGVPERIKFRLCVLAFWCLHGTAPRYLAETLHLTASRSSCSRLRSVDTLTLIVPATRRRTLGDRACPVAAARAWNSLPSFVRDKQSLAAFRHQLKTVLFRTSFGEDANTWAASLSTRDCFSVC